MDRTDYNVTVLYFKRKWFNNFILNKLDEYINIRIHIMIIICYFDVQNTFYLRILSFISKLQNKNNKTMK
jgi:hypothetical protein